MPISRIRQPTFRSREGSLPAFHGADGHAARRLQESYESFALTPHSGALNMGVLIKGERAKLDELRRTDAFERFSLSLAQLFTGYGVIPGVSQEGMRKVAERNPDLTK